MSITFWQIASVTTRMANHTRLTFQSSPRKGADQNAFPQISVRFHTLCCLLCSWVVLSKQSSRDLKEQTAQATADVKRDAKAVAAGISEGWSRDKQLDLNTATKDQLLSLPGVNRGRGRPSDCRASLWRSWRRGDAAHYAQDRV